MIVAPRVVAVEAQPRVEVQLRALPRPNHHPAFRTGEPGARHTAVEGVAGPHLEPVAIGAETGQGAQPWRPCRFVLHVCRGARLPHGILPDGVDERARLRLVQPDVRDVVVPELQTKRVLHRASAPHLETAMREPGAGDEAMVCLVELVAANGIVQEEGEVGEQVEVVADPVGRHARRGVSVRALPLQRSAVTVGVAAIRAIDRPESVDRPVGNRPVRYLVGGVPGPSISHPGDRESVERVALAVSEQTVDLSIAIGPFPRTIVVLELERPEHAAPACASRAGEQRPPEAPLTCAEPHDRPFEGVG